MCEKPQKSAEPMETQMSYQLAYSIFRDRNLRFSLREDYTGVDIPTQVDVKSFSFPPDACFVLLNWGLTKAHLYWPWLRIMKEEVTEELDDDEVSWMIRFLDCRGEKLDEGEDTSMWLVPQAEFQALQTLCRMNPTERRNIVAVAKPDQPIPALLKTLEPEIRI
ncbi:MAG TPA: hypothetical protein VJ574_01820 [Candidatus Bathyarchaeia archaeon]|nr:hypothetical protein [Candidatus Bathyarchaeia archaeon]